MSILLINYINPCGFFAFVADLWTDFTFEGTKYYAIIELY